MWSQEVDPYDIDDGLLLTKVLGRQILTRRSTLMVTRSTFPNVKRRSESRKTKPTSTQNPNLQLQHPARLNFKWDRVVIGQLQSANAHRRG